MSVIPGGAEKFKATEHYTKFPGTGEALDRVLQENEALIAGGSILSRLSPKPWNTNDLDIYVSCRRLSAIVSFLTRNGFEKVKGFKASEYCSSFLRRNNIRTVYTFANAYFGINIDVMAVRHKSTPLQVVQNFDLTICQTWYDGRDVSATHPKHIEEMKAELQGDYVKVFLTGNKFLHNRIRKYNSRGYEINIQGSIPAVSRYMEEISPKCGTLKQLEEGDKGKTWARKYLFRIAMNNEYKYINLDDGVQTRSFIDIDNEDGYDSDDYVKDPQKILDIESADVLKEKGADFYDYILNSNEVQQRQVFDWETKYVYPFKEELDKLTANAVEPVWKGFTKKDVEFLDIVFAESVDAESLSVENPAEVLYSMCPVCLKYIAHEDQTCMYMTHDCKVGKYYHKELYNKYKINKTDGFGRPLGQYVISWCTLCGRICGNHRHYTLGTHDAKLRLLPDAGRPYESDCRRTSGGGGTPEKIARFRALRAAALRLNERKGEITNRKAYNELVEAMWDGPLTASKSNLSRVLLSRVLADKKFNVPTEAFPNNNKTPTVYPNVPYPNVGNTDLIPIVHPEATEQFKNFYDVDDENIVQFRHKRSDGTVNMHAGEGEQIAKSMLLNYISSLMDQKDTNKFGMCWQYPTCTARMYPEEILAIVDKEDPSEMQIYQQYKDGFNEKYAQQGGASRKTRRRVKKNKARTLTRVKK